MKITIRWAQRTISYGRVPERPKGADCKSAVYDFSGSNPLSPTNPENVDLSTFSGLFLFLKGKGEKEPNTDKF